MGFTWLIRHFENQNKSRKRLGELEMLISRNGRNLKIHQKIKDIFYTFCRFIFRLLTNSIYRSVQPLLMSTKSTTVLDGRKNTRPRLILVLPSNILKFKPKPPNIPGKTIYFFQRFLSNVILTGSYLKGPKNQSFNVHIMQYE